MPDIIPNEMYALLHHDGNIGRFPDFEEVDWVKLDDKYYTNVPGPRFSYKRQGELGKELPAPSTDAWRRFLERLDEIGVFSWKNVKVPDEDNENLVGYEPQVWMFEIRRPGMKNFKRKGPIDKLPEGFDRFCEALSELMGGQGFGADR